jgi:hypothetical protein
MTKDQADAEGHIQLRTEPYVSEHDVQGVKNYKVVNPDTGEAVALTPNGEVLRAHRSAFEANGLRDMDAPNTWQKLGVGNLGALYQGGQYGTPLEDPASQRMAAQHPTASALGQVIYHGGRAPIDAAVGALKSLPAALGFGQDAPVAGTPASEPSPAQAAAPVPSATPGLTPAQAAAPAGPATTNTNLGGSPSSGGSDYESQLNKGFTQERAAVDQGAAAERAKNTAVSDYQNNTANEYQQRIAAEKARMDQVNAQSDRDVQGVKDAMAEKLNTFIDPNRIFHNMSTGQRITAGLGTILSNIGGAIAGQRPADVIGDAVDRDVKAQQMSFENGMANKKENVQNSTSLYNLARQRGLSDVEAYHVATIGGLEAAKMKLDALTTGMNNPVVDARAQLAKAEIVKQQFAAQQALKDELQNRYAKSLALESEKLDLDRKKEMYANHIYPPPEGYQYVNVEGQDVLAPKDIAKEAGQVYSSYGALASALDKAKQIIAQHPYEMKNPNSPYAKAFKLAIADVAGNVNSSEGKNLQMQSELVKQYLDDMHNGILTNPASLSSAVDLMRDLADTGAKRYSTFNRLPDFAAARKNRQAKDRLGFTPNPNAEAGK